MSLWVTISAATCWQPINLFIEDMCYMPIVNNTMMLQYITMLNIFGTILQPESKKSQEFQNMEIMEIPQPKLTNKWSKWTVQHILPALKTWLAAMCISIDITEGLRGFGFWTTSFHLKSVCHFYCFCTYLLFNCS